MLAPQLRVAVPEGGALEGRRKRSHFPMRVCRRPSPARRSTGSDRPRAPSRAAHRVIKPVAAWSCSGTGGTIATPCSVSLGELIGYGAASPTKDEEHPGEPWFARWARTVVRDARGVEPGRARRLSLDGQVPSLTAEPKEREESPSGRPRARVTLQASGSPLPRPDLRLRLRATQLTRGSSGMRATSS
jgi:hypothetical protein